VALCIAYEFEDTFAAVTDAQRVDTTDLSGLEFCWRAYKLARLASGSPDLARRLAPYPRSKVTFESDFELFFPVFSQLMNCTRLPRSRTGVSGRPCAYLLLAVDVPCFTSASLDQPRPSRSCLAHTYVRRRR
jgi:hypothetical protein